MDTIIYRYFGKSDKNFIKGNDYIAVDENSGQVCLYNYVERNDYTIWVNRSDVKQVIHAYTQHGLPFKNDWYHYSFFSRKTSVHGKDGCWTAYPQLTGKVRKIAEHLFQIEEDKEIILLHLVGNFEQDEKGRVIIEHITQE